MRLKGRTCGCSSSAMYHLLPDDGGGGADDGERPASRKLPPTPAPAPPHEALPPLKLPGLLPSGAPPAPP